MAAMREICPTPLIHGDPTFVDGMDQKSHTFYIHRWKKCLWLIWVDMDILFFFVCFENWWWLILWVQIQYCNDLPLELHHRDWRTVKVPSTLPFVNALWKVIIAYIIIILTYATSWINNQFSLNRMMLPSITKHDTNKEEEIPYRARKRREKTSLELAIYFSCWFERLRCSLLIGWFTKKVE